MSQIVTKQQMEAKEGWESSDKSPDRLVELAEHNKLRHGTVEIDIVGQLVCEEVIRHKLVQLAKQIRKENGNESIVKDDQYCVYGAALRHLQ